MMKVKDPKKRYRLVGIRVYFYWYTYVRLGVWQEFFGFFLLVGMLVENVENLLY